jgi:hypothetical protein
VSRENIAEKIKFELEMIKRELAETAPLFYRLAGSKPDIVEMRAIASTLHSFYNGIEKVLIIISRNVDNDIISSDKWHKSLLTIMTRPTSSRNCVLSDVLSNDIKKYLSFRHFYRHAYGFTLDWEQLKPLCDDIQNIFNRFESEILKFINT